MTIWVVLISMALITSLGIIFGLRLNHSILARKDGAVAILKDQLSELTADLDRGIISKDEAEAATGEIKRRLLNASRINSSTTDNRSGRAVIAIAAILVPLVAGGIYWRIGAPNVDSQPIATRMAERERIAEIAVAAGRLKEGLLSDENGGATGGWVLLGQIYMRMGQFADAANAFARATDREDADSSVYSQHAEALVSRDNGIVTPPAERSINQALQLDPENAAATFYKAQALEQRGELAEGRALLIGRLRRTGQYYPWMEPFVTLINRLGEQSGAVPLKLADIVEFSGEITGPSASDIAAAGEMSAEERNEMIRSMVERLAERLENDPNDLDGWLRLLRSYTVLGDDEAASDARNRALGLARALPDNDPRKTAILNQLDATEE